MNTRSKEEGGMIKRVKEMYQTITRTKIKVGEKAPKIRGKSYYKGEIREYEMKEEKGKYHVIAFYCRDFSRICPKEIKEISENIDKFKELKTEVIGISVDSVEEHKRMCSRKDEKGIGEIEIELIEDVNHQITESYGLLSIIGVSNRATIIIDDKGIVRRVDIHSMITGRNVKEIINELKNIITIDKKKNQN
ncbi:peroxiredoxin-4, putative [Entamoeba dispar SAW760]|uniref:Peroxiredoxin-4, putative n=1 Tax=Entamoeba dispar (strain ATCC PRA-260 / SAW760) TaxID=370354 RepID=B0E6W6_ENTDS|nr:peroxiredoxin-4, putative [Entamoeba dispar SAW760]EDR29707.1 peroxiredoxin-4, putative [Entamoeba dispar SAW760]|eukprot:EDR29707.1 peroxiredoxin-4, putative [Entamoeba dispar SAW760]